MGVFLRGPALRDAFNYSVRAVLITAEDATSSRDLSLTRGPPSTTVSESAPVILVEGRERREGGAFA